MEKKLAMNSLHGDKQHSTITSHPKHSNRKIDTASKFKLHKRMMQNFPTDSSAPLTSDLAFRVKYLEKDRTFDLTSHHPSPPFHPPCSAYHKPIEAREVVELVLQILLLCLELVVPTVRNESQRFSKSKFNTVERRGV